MFIPELPGHYAFGVSLALPIHHQQFMHSLAAAWDPLFVLLVCTAYRDFQ